MKNYVPRRVRDLRTSNAHVSALPKLTESQGQALRYSGERVPLVLDPCRVMGGKRKNKRPQSPVIQPQLRPYIRPRISARVAYAALERAKNPPPKMRELPSIGGLTLITKA